MIRKLLSAFVICMTLSLTAAAQDSSQHKSLSFSGYIDAYIAHYSDSVGLGNYQKFPSVSPRSNEAGLNVAMITAKYSADKVRGIITLHYGDIPSSTWSSKFTAIQEANVGLLICKNLWLDGGFFRTHFGTEALFPKENYTSSVAVPTFFEPYFEAGLRLNYNPNDKLSFYGYFLNGYGIYEDNNHKKSAGLLVTYVCSEKINFGYSGYYGDDSFQGRHFRLAHNVFFNLKLSKVKVTVGADFITQQHSRLSNPNKMAFMGSGMIITSFNVTKRFRIYDRFESFGDPNGVLSGVFFDSNNKLTGLNLWGITGGMEFKPIENAYIRLETRGLFADTDQKIFSIIRIRTRIIDLKR